MRELCTCELYFGLHHLGALRTETPKWCLPLYKKAVLRPVDKVLPAQVPGDFVGEGGVFEGAGDAFGCGGRNYVRLRLGLPELMPIQPFQQLVEGDRLDRSMRGRVGLRQLIAQCVFCVRMFAGWLVGMCLGALALCLTPALEDLRWVGARHRGREDGGAEL